MANFQYSSRMLALSTHNDVVINHLGRSYDGSDMRILKSSARQDARNENIPWHWLPIHMQLSTINGSCQEDDYFDAVMRPGRTSFANCELPWIEGGKTIDEMAKEIANDFVDKHTLFGYFKTFMFYGGDLNVRPSAGNNSLIFTVTINPRPHGNVVASIPGSKMRGTFLEIKDSIRIHWATAAELMSGARPARVPQIAVKSTLMRLLARAQACIVRADTQEALYTLVQFAGERYQRQFRVFIDWMNVNHPEILTLTYGSGTAATCWWLRKTLTLFLPYYQVPEIYEDIPF